MTRSGRPAVDPLGALTLALLLLVTVAAWAGVVAQSRAMPMAAPPGMAVDMPGMPAAAAPTPGPAALLAYVLSWTVMMAAMMLPSAAPMILLYATAARGRVARGEPFVPTWIFVLGYLAVWAAFGAGVYLVERVVALALAGHARADRWMAYGVALVLIAAGAYQLSPLKRACLRACRHPLVFLMQHWRPGADGAFAMGVAHGWYCAGCCIGLMAVLVAAGAMGLPWVLLIALVVAAEKLLAPGEWTARLAGGVLLMLGALVGAQPQLAPALRGAGW